MRKKDVGVAILVLIAVSAGIWYAYSLTGIYGVVSISTKNQHPEISPVGAIIEIWQKNKLISTNRVTAVGKFEIKLPPGSYDVLFSAEGFISGEFPQLKIAPFKRLTRNVVLLPPMGGGLQVASYTVDTTTVIVRKGREDIWLQWKNTRTGTPHRMAGSAVALPFAPRTEAEAETAARKFMATFLADNRSVYPIFDQIDLTTLEKDYVRKYNQFWFVTFNQETAGPVANQKLPVFGSEASVTIHGGDIIQFGIELFPSIKINPPVSFLSRSQVLETFRQYKPEVQVDTAKVQLLIFPIPKSTDSTFFDYKLAYELLTFENASNRDLPYESRKYVINASTARTLFRETIGPVSGTGYVRAKIYDKSPEESTPTLKVLGGGLIGNTNFGMIDIDSSGIFLFPDGLSVKDFNILLKNDPFTLYDSNPMLLKDKQLGRQPIYKIYQMPLTANQIKLTENSDGRVEVNLGLNPWTNAFYHLNKIHDYFYKWQLPNFLFKPLKVYFVPSEENAFFDRALAQIWFGQIKANNEPFAMRSDMIYHEYAHAVVQNLTSKNTPAPQSLPPKDETGAMLEGFSDYFACTINDDAEWRAFPPTHPRAAENRRLQNAFQYHTDFKRGAADNGFIHFNSQIFSGILWDLRSLLMQKMGAIKGKRYADEVIVKALLIPPVPKKFKAFGVTLLNADDDDNQLFNGTPNIQEIVKAFKLHGIEIPAFDKSAPKVQNFYLTTGGYSRKSFIEEGSPVYIKATMVDNGYGLNTDSLKLEINGKRVPLEDKLTMTRDSYRAQLNYLVAKGEPVRSQEFGPSLAARLVVEDKAGNKITVEKNKDIKDTIKPDYELVECSSDARFLYASIRISDLGSGVDPASIDVRINNQAFSKFKVKKVSEYEYILSIQYPKQQLQQISHHISAKIADRAGNVNSEQRKLTSLCLTPCLFSSVVVLIAAGMNGRRRRNRRNQLS
ncbi:MAG: hypothetical protein ACE5HS_00615 [bacterium]